MSIMDYEYPKQYDDDDNELEIDPNHVFNVTIRNLLKGTKKEKELKLKRLYNLDENNHFEAYGEETRSPYDWLFENVKKTKNGVLILPSVDGRTRERNKAPEFFLNSELMDDNIELSTTKRIYRIEEKKQLEWLFDKGLGYPTMKARKDYYREHTV